MGGACVAPSVHSEKGLRQGLYYSVVLGGQLKLCKFLAGLSLSRLSQGRASKVVTTSWEFG